MLFVPFLISTITAVSSTEMFIAGAGAAAAIKSKNSK